VDESWGCVAAKKKVKVGLGDRPPVYQGTEEKSNDVANERFGKKKGSQLEKKPGRAAARRNIGKQESLPVSSELKKSRQKLKKKKRSRTSVEQKRPSPKLH